MVVKKTVKKAAPKATALASSVDEIFGMNAGKVWMALHDAPAGLAPEKIVSATGLSAANAWGALGWLAREGKLRVEGSKFVLNE